MNNGVEQLVAYIRQQLQQGIAKETIRQSLLQNNWDITLVDQSFSMVDGSTPYSNGSPTVSSAPQKHRVRNGVLWILSPIILLVGVVVINVIVRLAGISSPIINIVSSLAGMAGILLIFVGPIVGIILLVSRK